MPPYALLGMESKALCRLGIYPTNRAKSPPAVSSECHRGRDRSLEELIVLVLPSKANIFFVSPPPSPGEEADTSSCSTFYPELPVSPLGRLPWSLLLAPMLCANRHCDHQGAQELQNPGWLAFSQIQLSESPQVQGPAPPRTGGQAGPSWQ